MSEPTLEQLEAELAQIDASLNALADAPLPEAARATAARALEAQQRELTERIAVRKFEQREVTAGNKGVAIGGDVHGNVAIHNGPPGDDPAALRRAWLQHILNQSDLLSLSGIDPAMAGQSGTRAHLSLNAVYTALLTLTAEERKAGLANGLDDRAMDGGRRRSALAELDRHGRLVLLGDPGGGKSSFVNFVALCLAGEALGNGDANLQRLTDPLPDEQGKGGEERQPWSHGAMLPLPIILRDFAATGLPPKGQRADARHLWRFIKGRLEAAALAEFAPHLKQELRERGGLILLDGLDEVPEAEQRREQVKQAVEAFVAAFGKCRYLVTSRTYAWQNQGWALNGFEESLLAPLSDGQIRRFIERWYAHAAALKRVKEENVAGRVNRLQQAIFGKGRLLGLARRPLLLTLMASLHAWRGGTLPEGRERLYADTVELLLDFWERQRLREDDQGQLQVQQPSITEWLETDPLKVRKVLERLAWQAHASQPEAQGTADINEGELVTSLLQQAGRPDLRPQYLVDYLRDRAGLLMPRGVGVYTFPHRSFQEYLAACWLTDRDFPREINRLVCEDPDRWREVALLAAAKAARGSASALWNMASQLCFESPGDTPSDARLWGAQVAGQIIAESGELEDLTDADRNTLERVRGWLVWLMTCDRLPASERVIAGQSLARLGDPRFDGERNFLPDDPTFGFRRVAAGSFLMGSDRERDAGALEPEFDQHSVDLPEVWLARWPVTVAQFRHFVERADYTDHDPRSLEGRDNEPVVRVSWHDAVAYCDWLQPRMVAKAEAILANVGLEDAARGFWQRLLEGRLRITLPSEAEWEKGARGTDGRIYPWGDGINRERANYADSEIGELSPVGCFPVGTSPFACEEVCGNVWEWTRSLYGKYPYPEGHARGEREDLNAKGLRVLRGGAFYDNPRSVRCSVRYRYDPVDRGDYLGFRLVASPFSDL
jgi:formylglycine-generating enzyme required for sulfatase activity